MSLDLGRYAESYLKTDGTEQPYDFCICNRSGEIVWSDKKQRLGDRIYEDFPGFPRTELGEDGKALFEDEGERYFAAWSKVHLGEDFFRVCMTTPSEEIFLVPSTITYLRRSINLLLLAIVLIAGLYTYRLYRLYREKYVQLKREVELQEKVREKSRELSSVERHYSVLFNNAHDGIFIMRGDTITDCNNRAAEMFGTGKQDLLGHRPYDLSPETQPDGSSSAELAEQYIGRCRSGTPQLFEWRHRRSDGSLFTAEISLSAIEIEGDVLIQAFIRDVTQRKEMEEHLQHALEEKETLLREVHHRTKNNMQLITSLLNLEHSSIEDPAALAVVTKSIRRIHALSTAHEYLHQSQNLLSINLGDYIKDFISVQLAELKDAEIRPEVSIESEIETSIEGAIPFGLIVNELIHNVRIHAFPEGGGGELQLRIYRESGQLVLIVEDNGLGKDGDIDVSDEGSLGVQLITSLVHQLGGSFEVRQNGGTRWYITFPLAADADNGTVESKLFFVRKS
jgi:PAS domain S-box-containing protein